MEKSILLKYTKRPKVFEQPKLQYIQQNLARAIDDINKEATFVFALRPLPSDLEEVRLGCF